MALSRELLKRLNSDEEPLPKRLKLAENAFCRVDLPIIRKEDLILQWLCKTCLMGHDGWQTLENCLKSEYLNIKYDVKELMVNLIIQKLSQDSETVCVEILRCCTLLITNIQMQQYFIYKPEDLGLLVTAILRYIYKFFKNEFVCENDTNKLEKKLSENTDQSLLIAYNTAVTTIESMTQIYKSAANKQDELKQIFIQDTLYNLCTIINYKCDINANRLQVAASACVQHVILSKGKNVQQTLDVNSDKNAFTDLFSTLAHNAEKRSLEKTLAMFVFVFRAAIDLYISNSLMIDFIFRKEIDAAGRYKYEVLNCLLPHINNITLNFDNKIKDITLSAYFEKLINEVLTNDILNDTECKVLIGISAFNPLLIEPKFKIILEKVLLQEYSTVNVNVLIAILEASMKLRRLQKLVSLLLIAIKDLSTYERYSDEKSSDIFPWEFKQKLTESVSNVTNSQSISMIRTLIFHLNTDCAELLQSNESCKNILLMKATAELLIALLDGMRIFEYSSALISHRNFVTALGDLKNVLSLLIDRALHLNHNKDIIMILLSVVLSWSEVYNMLKYYVPKIIEQELEFPIPEDHWQQLIQRITNFGEDECKNSMNKLILHRLKTRLPAKSIKLKNLIGGTEYFWDNILQYNPELILFVNGKETSKIVNLLLNDMTSNKNHFDKWTKILKKECVEGNKDFMISLLNSTLVHIQSTVATGITNLIMQHVYPGLIAELETNKNEKINEIFCSIKDEISNNGWKHFHSSVVNKIELYLKILLHTPLIVFNADVRTLIFIIVYVISQECAQSGRVSSLCEKIFSDVSEKSDLSVFRCMEPVLLTERLPQNKIFQNIFEQSLQAVTSYATLKSIVNSTVDNKDSMCVVLRCFDNVTSKINAEHRPIFKKAEKKLNRLIVKSLPENVQQPDEIKSLILSLKVATANKEVSENLINTANVTLRTIFTPKTNSEEKFEENLISEGFQLTLIMLQNRSIFEIKDETIQQIWHEMLKCPSNNLLLPLLESTKVTEFQTLLKCLHDQMIKSLSGANSDMQNVYTIWNAILKTDMSANRNKLRRVAITNLLQSIQDFSVPQEFWPHFLKLLQNIFNAKHFSISDNMIDICIYICLKSLNVANMFVCNDVLSLSGILLKMRTIQVTDRLPTFLLLYKHIINVIVHASKETSGKFDEHRFRCLMIDIEKLTNILIKLKKDIGRVSPYIIADLLSLLTENSVPPFIKASLENCIGQLISICDQHGIALLSRAVPTSMQGILKFQLDRFNKFHKFCGKI